MKINLAIVCSTFNEEITGKMLSEAEKAALGQGANVVEKVQVPGAFEIPFAVSLLLGRKDVDAVATVGAVIKGQTKHDEAIMSAICSELSRLSIQHKKPVGLGISGPGITFGQARARIKDYAARSVGAAIRMAYLKRGLRHS